ncbi:hypothetical protein SAMD00023353_7900290 [Rosellinia necatrix]|uniref:Uncharacterized protein n=1 Tax=Rosellinia necatrix TaxID=77044 RepID=A0A1W2TUX5_ROSNE|nr:hypothetical protein SAMD00023353_7900290 [Rosellinia necatrix]
MLGCTISEAQAECYGHRVVDSALEAMSDGDAAHLIPYVDWTIETDMSVVLPGSMERQRYMNEYRWYSVEIISPALWPTDASWEEIHAVVRAIAEKYWIVTPPTAGLHYHYGNGKEYIPFHSLRRMAAFLVAVDPLMAQLHPPHRRTEELCLSNRLYARVAHGTTAEEVSEEIGVAEDVEAAPELPSLAYQPQPVARPSCERSPGFTVPFARGQLAGYPRFDARWFRGSGFASDRGRAAAPVAVADAARQVLRCTSAPAVAELMKYSEGFHRPAYNFQNYRKGVYRNPELVRDPKRTVEFRQMAATMDADEVVAHGRVVVRLCEFAARAGLDALWRLVLDCGAAERRGDWFDVFDLLAALGLEAEADVLQRSVAQFQGQEALSGCVWG